MNRRRLVILLVVGLMLVGSVGSAWVRGNLGDSAIDPELSILLVVLFGMWICLLLNPDMYLESFWGEYLDDVEKRKDSPRISQQPTIEMSSLPLVICGCCRDVEAYLPAVLASMHQVGSLFREYHVVIFENDSKDGTREILRAEQARFPDRMTLLLEDGMKSPKRTERLAIIRNRLLAEALRIDARRGGLMLMMDMDDVAFDGTLAETIGTCFRYPFESWDVLATNRRETYYDIFALRIRGHIEYDFAEKCRRYTRLEDHRKYFLRFRKGLRKSDCLVPVLSAFGGAALYKMRALVGKRYVGLDEHGREICEHLSVHDGIIREGGAIFINTHMVMA